MRTFALLSKLRHRGLVRRSVAGLAAVLVLATPSVLIAASPASASTGPVDDRLNSTATGWWTYGNVSASTLGSLLSSNGARLTDLQVDSVSPLTFSATMVKNTGSYSSGYWWYYGVTATQISSALSTNNARLISLAPYTTTGSDTLFAAVMVPNTGANAKTWAWYYNISPAQIGTFLSANTGRLIRMQSAVINGSRQYSVIMVSNTGTDNLGWYYYFGQTTTQVNNLTSTNGARLIDINRRDDGLFDVVMYKNTGKVWFWYVNSSVSALTTRAVALGARIIDINSYVIGSTRYYAAIYLDNSSALTGRARQPFLDTGLSQAIATGNGYFGFELKPVGGAVSTALRNTTAYEPASAIKVLFHLYAMRAIAAGTASDTTPVTYMTVLNVSCPSSGPATTTLKNAMTLMMQQSDNAMTRAVVDHFGAANIQSYASSIGLTATHINHEVGCPTLNTLNTTSLADLTKIYEGVSDGTLLNPNYKATFYARMLNQSNYSPFVTYICGLAQQEATKLGKSASVASSFCHTITWAAKGGDYTIGNGTTTYDFHGGLADYGFPIKSNGVVTTTKHYVAGEYVDHVIYANSTQATNIGKARSAAQTAALLGPIDQALATW